MVVRHQPDVLTYGIINFKNSRCYYEYYFNFDNHNRVDLDLTVRRSTWYIDSFD